MFGGVRKVPTECPHCGFTQHEPSGLISTYCRGCGSHYTVPAHAAPIIPKISLPTPLLGGPLARQRRPITCNECGHDHTVAPEAKNSFCTACGTEIDLSNVEVPGHSTRVVQTRGNVHVGRDGFLNSTKVTCGNAVIEGRIAGKVTCSGTLRLKGSGLCRAQITTRQLIIDRGTTLRFLTTIRASEIVIRGLVEADVDCRGTLHIGRYGGLDGDVHARSMIVDKGGHYAGEVKVTTHIHRPEPVEREETAPRVLPGWQTGLAFG
jgi:cytoskeletal protein CcmA (bactofilin family)